MFLKVGVFVDNVNVENIKWLKGQFSYPVQINSEDQMMNNPVPWGEYDFIFLLGMHPMTPWKLPYDVIQKAWEYVKEGGFLYGENISCVNFPSSRLFGFEQDYPPVTRTHEKLRINSTLFSETKNNLLEWNGHFQKGFSFNDEYTNVLLSIGTYKETHHAVESANEYPGLVQRKLGTGITLYSTYSFLTQKENIPFRPNWLWNKVINVLKTKWNVPINKMENNLKLTESQSDVAIDKAAKWFLQSGILPCSDGSKGVFENVHSFSMEVTKDYRPDCHAQTALMFYLYSLYTKDLSWEKRAHNLLNYLFENGYQDTDENSKTYGFWKWFNFPEKYPENIFTDDNSWVCITLLYLYKQTGKEEYKKRGLMTAEALLRTQNENGLRAEQLLGSKLRKYGLDYVKSAPMSMNPHFESIAHVAFILAYQVSNNEKYLETAYRGTKYLLENKSQMKWMYSLTSANSRFLLAISALLRYKDDDVLKHGLNDIIKYLKSNHHRRGGVEEADNPDPERYGAEDTGVYLYNNEGIADLLYTNNFLLMNLWETWKAVNKEEYYSYYTKVRDFIAGIQISSREERFDGGWMRSFDMSNNEYFGNNGDTGWGPYCIEGGWTVAIISIGLLLEKLNLSLFDLPK